MPLAARFFLFIFIALAPSAQAQLFRAYLSVSGSDVNPCTLQQPCRLLPAALTAVAPGGEIWMLDSANFNTATVMVTKSVSILAVPGATGSIVGTGAAALQVATADVALSLRNLVFVPLASAPSAVGLSATAASSIVVDQCQFAGFTGEAIVASGLMTLSVKDTTIRNSHIGLKVRGGVRAVATNVKIFNPGAAFPGAGFWAEGGAAGTITHLSVEDSLVSGGYAGYMVYTAAVTSGVVRMNVVRSTASSNEYGVASVGFTGLGEHTVSLGSSVINGAKQYGLLIQAPGTMKSLGNNQVSDNTNPVSGPLTALAPM